MPTITDFSHMDIRSATFAALTAEPSSDIAKMLCQSLANDLFHQSKRGPTKQQQKATRLIIADLLERDPAQYGGWLYHGFSTRAFVGAPVGYKPFIAVFEKMRPFMVQTVGGTRQYTTSEFTGGNRQIDFDRATRFRADPWLRDLFAKEGITCENWHEHFTRTAQPINRKQSPLALRSIKKKRFNGHTFRRSLFIDKTDAQVVQLLQRMDRLNEFLEKQTFEPFGPVFLRRIFASDPETATEWNLGGRLYAVGGENYQNAKKDLRPSITINGETVTELDVVASHLTLLAGLNYLPSCILDGDPYHVEQLPRSVVKQWVTMTISHGSRHRAWPKAVKNDFLQKEAIDLSKEFPLRSTGDLILQKLPIVGDNSKATLASWGELQFVESEIVLKTIEDLAFEHGVAALPVHDSIIVPQSKVGLATKILKGNFKRIGGIEPQVRE